VRDLGVAQPPSQPPSDLALAELGLEEADEIHSGSRHRLASGVVAM
jgi:hypothetical protein